MKQEPILNLPSGTKFLCLANLFIFIATYFMLNMLGEEKYVNLIYNFALVPSRYFSKPLGIEAIYSIFTHMFIHGGLLHFSINIGMLMALGSAVEKELGTKKFIIFYISSGILALIPHILIYSSSVSPMIGASGAISGLFAAVIILINRGKDKKKLLTGIGVFIAATIIFGILGMPGLNAEIAWIVHLGGFAAGLLLYYPIEKLR